MAVEPREAGKTVRCECGAQLLAPKLSELHRLPLAEQAPEIRPASAWSFAQGALSAGLLAAAALVGLAGYLYWTEPPKPIPFSAEVFSKNAAEQIAETPPAYLFGMWHSRYLPLTLRGFQPIENPAVLQAETKIAQARSYEWWLLIAAAIAAGLGAATYVAARPPRS